MDPYEEATPGRRIRLTSTADPFTRLKPGAFGTVKGFDDTGTLLVRWDDGSRLGLVPGIDTFEFADNE